MLLPRGPLASAIALLVSSSLVQHVAAQVKTDCQPLNTTCPPDPALGMELYTHFNTTPKSSVWENHVGSMTYNVDDGAAFTINKQGDVPTIRSKFYFFFGRAEVWMKAAPGTGIVSSIMFLSDDLDEIDWEFLGGQATNVSTNIFGKGIEDYSHGKVHEIGDTQNTYRNYTIWWTKDALDFYVDGNKIRTITPKEANDTHQYPQTPMRLFLGPWAGGDKGNEKGVIDWAGGETDYSKGPFTMHVRSATIEDFSSGKEYVYGDHSGSWQSIQVVEGNSTVKEIVLAPPEKSLNDKWNELPSTAKTAIYACAAGLGTVLVAFGIFYCIRQRRRGSEEAKKAEEKYQQERLELEQFKKAGIDPDSFTASAHEYNAKEMREDGTAHRDSYSVPTTAAATPTTGTETEKWQTAAAIGVGAGAGASAAAAAGGAMRSPMPLLRDGAQSPRSPESVGFNAPYSDRAANSMSPAPNQNYGGARSPPPMGNTHAAPYPNYGGAQSPPVGNTSPAPYPDYGGGRSPPPMGSMHTTSPAPYPDYGGARSPPPMGDMRSQSPMGPGMMANGVHQPHPPSRSFTSPGPIRMASPGPQQPAYGMVHPQPQRSFTTQGGFSGQPGGFDFGVGQQGGFAQQGGSAGGWNQGEQGYWNGGNR